ncbi:hypothetical protein PENTCL1PPCAC_30462, partial [Pristionchus entomophagus]
MSVHFNSLIFMNRPPVRIHSFESSTGHNFWIDSKLITSVARTTGLYFGCVATIKQILNMRLKLGTIFIFLGYI